MTAIYPRQAERESDDNDDREHLLPQQMAPAAVEEAVSADGVDALVREETKQERAEDTADEVYSDDVERVIETEKQLQPSARWQISPASPPIMMAAYVST